MVETSLYKFPEGSLWTISEENIWENIYSVHLYQAQVFLLYFFFQDMTNRAFTVKGIFWILIQLVSAK